MTVGFMSKIRDFSLGGIVLMTATLMGGCASKPAPVRTDLSMVVPGQLPPPKTTDLIIPPRSYLIGPMDKLQIDVFGLPELSRSIQVDSSGYVSLPLVGPIQASGKTPIELGESYATSLRRSYVRDPKVTVNLTDTVSQIVTVGGSVMKPGNYPVMGRMTLMRALAQAEGLTEFSKQDEVVIYRRVNNRDMAALYDLRAIRQGAYPDPDIYANDVIEVGESRGRRIFKDLIGASALLTAPIVALITR
ncbi:polysaccharide export outer membrane protein [Sphingomonas sp. SORGH_AS 950]|nr:polysaccharide export outer membrane protein [Sphingomonas sp. SORGH_AS_0950]